MVNNLRIYNLNYEYSETIPSNFFRFIIISFVEIKPHEIKTIHRSLRDDIATKYFLNAQPFMKESKRVVDISNSPI